MADKDPVLLAVEEVKKGLSDQLESYKKELDKKLEDRVKEINEEGKKDGKTLSDVLEDVKKEQKKFEDEFNEYRKQAGKIKGGGDGSPVTFKKVLHEVLKDNKDAIFSHKTQTNVNFDMKAVQTMTTSNTHTGDTGITQLFRQQARGIYKWHLRDLVQVMPSEFDTVNYPQEVVPAGEGSFGTQTEGSAKATVDYDTKIVTLSLTTEAGIGKVSRQMIRNLPFLEAYLNTSLTEDFLRREDRKFLNSIASSATAGSTSETIKAAKLIDFMVQVENAGYTATAFVTTPAMWAEVLKTKPNDYSIPGGTTISASGEVLICGLPIYKSPLVTTNRVYVGDWSKVAIAQSEAFNIRMTDTNSDDFDKNLISFRAEAAIGLIEWAPSAFVFGVL